MPNEWLNEPVGRAESDSCMTVSRPANPASLSSVGVFGMAEGCRHDALLAGCRDIVFGQEVLDCVIVAHHHCGPTVFGVGAEELRLQVSVAKAVGHTRQCFVILRRYVPHIRG